MTDQHVPAVSSVLELQESEQCPACQAQMTGVELRVELAPVHDRDGDGGVRLAVVRTVAAGVPCGCVIHDRSDTGERDG